MYWVPILSNVSSLRGLVAKLSIRDRHPHTYHRLCQALELECPVAASACGPRIAPDSFHRHPTLPLHLCRGVALPAHPNLTSVVLSDFPLPISQTSWNTEKHRESQMAAILDMDVQGGVSPIKMSSCPRRLCRQSNNFKAGYQQKN